jgi:hypothetical protein
MNRSETQDAPAAPATRHDCGDAIILTRLEVQRFAIDRHSTVTS